MTVLRRIERFLPLFAAGVAAILLFSGLASLGLWDPWELDAADRAKELSDNGSVPLWSGLAIRAGFALFGNHEWAGRLFGALGMFATVLTSMALALRVADRRGAAYAGVVAASTPLVILHSQLMLGDGLTIGFQSLVGLGLVGLVAPFSERVERRRAERAAWLVLTIAAVAGATLTRGVLLGVLAPLVAMLGIVVTTPPRDNESRIAGALISVVALVVGFGTARAVYVDSSTFSLWLGGLPVGTNPPTFDAGIENIFHSLAPWSPVLLIAVVRTMADGSEHAWLKRMYVLWGVLAWVAYVIFSSRYGLPTFLAIAPLAALVGACLREIEDETTADRVSAIVVVLFSGLIIRDFALYPSSALSSLPVDSIGVPVGLDPRKKWAVAMMLVTVPLALALALKPLTPIKLEVPAFLRSLWARDVERDPRGVQVASVTLGLMLLGLIVRLLKLERALGASGSLGPLIAIIPVFVLTLVVLGGAVFSRDAEVPITVRLPGIIRDARERGGASAFWVAAFALIAIACLVFGIIARVGGEALGFSSLLVRAGPVIALVPVLAIFAYFLGEVVVARFHFGRFRMAPAVLGGVLFGCWVAFGFSREVSEHFSPRELYQTYTVLRRPGDVLLDYHTGGRASRYYAPEPIEILQDQQQLIRKLAEEGRRWALFPRGDLPTVDREFRRLRNRHLFVADASNQRFVLVTNSPIRGRSDASPLSAFVRNEAPNIQRPLNPPAVFGSAIELLGYDLELPGGDTVGPGQKFFVTWYWKARTRPPGAYTIFLHVDGAGKRLNGDHVPVDGLVPVASWEPGDIVVDRQELTVPTDFRTGEYTFFIGFFSGENRLPVTSGAKDDANRAIAGTLQVR